MGAMGLSGSLCLNNNIRRLFSRVNQPNTNFPVIPCRLQSEKSLPQTVGIYLYAISALRWTTED